MQFTMIVKKVCQKCQFKYKESIFWFGLFWWYLAIAFAIQQKNELLNSLVFSIKGAKEKNMQFLHKYLVIIMLLKYIRGDIANTCIYFTVFCGLIGRTSKRLAWLTNILRRMSLSARFLCYTNQVHKRCSYICLWSRCKKSIFFIGNKQSNPLI